MRCIMPILLYIYIYINIAHACVSSRGAQSTELVSLYIGYWTLNNYYYYYYKVEFFSRKF